MREGGREGRREGGRERGTEGRREGGREGGKEGIRRRDIEWEKVSEKGKRDTEKYPSVTPSAVSQNLFLTRHTDISQLSANQRATCCDHNINVCVHAN